MTTLKWEESEISGIFKIFKLDGLTRQPIVVQPERETFPSKPTGTKFHFQFRGSHTVVIRRVGEDAIDAELWLCDLIQNGQYRLVRGSRVPFPSSVNKLNYELPPGRGNRFEGKILVVDKWSNRSLAVAYVESHAEILILKDETFAVSPLTGLAKPYDPGAGFQPAHDSLTLSWDSLPAHDRARFEEIFRQGKQLIASSKSHHWASPQKHPVGWARAISLWFVRACPPRPYDHLAHFESAPSLRNLLNQYWPQFIQFRDAPNLRDSELVWALTTLRQRHFPS